MNASPEAFSDRNIAVWIYHGEYLDPQAENTIRAVAKERRNSKIAGYQNVRPSTTHAGMYVIDVPYSIKNDEPKLGRPTVWKMLSEGHIKSFSAKGKFPKGNVGLCFPVKQIAGCTIGRNDMKNLQKL
ncbi:MAG: hypothetical protein ABL931_18185, partial [Usitatibacteraceae bacterium]